MEYVGRLPTPQSKTTRAHYISYKNIGRDFIRHDDRRAYTTRIEGEYKAYLIFYRQAGVEGNINTTVIPPEINLPVWHKTRVINRANPSASLRGSRGGRGAGGRGGRGRGRGRAGKSVPAPARSVSSPATNRRNKRKASSPKKIIHRGQLPQPPHTASIEPFTRRITRQTSKVSPVTSSPNPSIVDENNNVTTHMDTGESNPVDPEPEAPSSKDTLNDNTTSSMETSENTSETANVQPGSDPSLRPPLISNKDDYPLDYDMEKYLDTSEEEEENTKGQITSYLSSSYVFYPIGPFSTILAYTSNSLQQINSRSIICAK